MGIIARQGIKRSLISLLGVVIGIFSTLLIYPLARDAYGFAGFIYGYGVLLSMLLGFGSSSLTVRYFPEFTGKSIKGYLGIILSFSLISIGVLSTILFILYKPILNLLQSVKFKNFEYLTDNIFIIYILAVILVFIRVLIYHSSNFKRIVIPSIINELAYKIVLPIIILLYYFHLINLEFIAYSILIYYLLSFVLNALYLKKLGGVSITKKTIFSLPKEKAKEMISYMGFSGLNALSGNVTTRIDVSMIPLLISFGNTGTYLILMNLSNIIGIPNVSLNQIASPIVSESLEKGDFKNIDSIYKKTSINSFLIGSIMFILIWSVFPDIIVSFMKNSDAIQPYIYVFFFLGISKLVDMLTSVNTYIIIYSKYYKYNLLFLGILAILNLVLNYFLILKYDIIGAAIATAISMVIYNIIKLIFIFYKFKLFPFTKHTFTLIAISIIVFMFGQLLPDINSAIGNIIYKPIVLLTIYYALLKVLKVQADILDLGEKTVTNLYKTIFTR